MPARVDRLRTEAWLLRGISGIPGELRLDDGVVSFVACGTGSAWPFQLRSLERLLAHPDMALEDRLPLQLFAWPVSQVWFELPWYYFGGGIKLRRQGMCLRFSFGQPAGAGRGLREAGAELRKLGPMRDRGRLWAAALSQSASAHEGG